jgi:hypothetical protein
MIEKAKINKISGRKATLALTHRESLNNILGTNNLKYIM